MSRDPRLAQAMHDRFGFVNDPPTLRPIAADHVLIGPSPQLPRWLLWALRPFYAWMPVQRTDGEWLEIGRKLEERWIHVSKVRAWSPGRERITAIRRYLSKNPDLPSSAISAPIILSG